MKQLKKAILILTVVIIAVMAAATCVESIKGAAYASSHVYGTWWFVLLWTALACTGAVYIMRSGLWRRMPVFMLHVSFLVILAGALTTWLTSERGTVHLRMGEPSSVFMSADSTTRDLGFTLTLDRFVMECYPGTDSPMDYVSRVNAGDEVMEISMNHIGRHHGFRFTQSGYDGDMNGTLLGVLHDPWGIGITYSGYVLLLLSIVAVLAGNAGMMKKWYRAALGGSAVKAAAVVSFVFLCAPAFAGNTVPSSLDRNVQEEFGRVVVLYSGRVCPVSTVAADFVMKLSGKASWNGRSAEDVFSGWTFNSTAWEHVPMIRIKDKVARKALGISGQWASYDDFWNSLNVYKLKAPLENAYREGDAAMVKHLRDADEKYNVIRMFYNGELLKMFPYSRPDGGTGWMAPGEKNIDLDLSEKEWAFVRMSMDRVAESVLAGDNARAVEILGKIRDYQRVRAADAVPPEWKLRCECIYDSLNSLRWPVMLYLTLSLILAVFCSLGISDGRDLMSGHAVLGIMLLHISVLLVLRWIVSGHVPLASGFETMQFLAWAILLLTVLLQRRFPVVGGFGPLLASFALLVAMIGSGNPKITPLMPVLQSPLLSVHVMVIMFSYALFALMMLIGVQGLICHVRGDFLREDSLAALSHTLLYPAVFFLTAGIFIGAVWANVSWGRYWSWDPKEVWALITMLVYAAPLHCSSFRIFSRPTSFHAYCVVAFLSVLFTYFGVNLILGGMHSYA